MAKSLLEVAQQCAPHEFRTWRRLFGLFSGEDVFEIPIRRISTLERRVAAKVSEWRARLLRYYDLDEQLLPPAEFAALPDFVLERLLAAPDLEARRVVIIEEACRRAEAEVKQEWRPRLERRARRSSAKVVEAVRAVLREDDVVVTGQEIRQAPFGPDVYADRAEISGARLVYALIDILAGQISEGPHRWGNISVSRRAAPSKAVAERTGLGSRQPLAKGEIPDNEHVEKMLAVREKHASWNKVITAVIDLNEVDGQSPEAKRKRLTRKASAAWRS
jgi:hypothetical protein